MKKIKLFICLFFISSFSISQTIYLIKDFNDLSLTSGGWTTQVVVDTTNWYATDYNGDQFAKISNYDNGNVPAEAWLISPGVDLSNSTQPNLSFGTIMKWPGAALTLYISTDYDGTSNPSVQGTWTDITSNATWDTNNASWGNWTSSGDVDLSNYVSNATYIAYKYTGTSSDGSTWEVDDILIKEGGSGNNSNNVSIYDIQHTTSPTGDSPYANQQVSTGGIVNFVRYDGTFYLASGSGEWTGIYVYDTTLNAIVGDSITLDAEVVEYYNLTELKSYKAILIKSDEINDLAILKIKDSSFKELKNLPYNFKTEIVDVGSEVFALGYPMALSIMGKAIKFTDGKISSKTGYLDDVTTYQTTTPIQPGNSGGPLFDYNGNLIGINSSGLAYEIADNVSYSIKTTYVRNLIDILPEKVYLPNDKSLDNENLTEIIKVLSNYVVLIKVK